MARTKRSPPAGALGYKGLFTGAAVLLSLVVPGALGYIISGFNDSRKAQWQSLRELNESVEQLAKTSAAVEAKLEAEHQAQRRDLDKHDDRITILEHRGERR